MSYLFFFGMGGMYGLFAVNIVMMEVDFMISIGCCFDDCLMGNFKIFVKNVKVVYIDIDLVEIGKIISVDIFVVGDVKKVL